MQDVNRFLDLESNEDVLTNSTVKNVLTVKVGRIRK